MVTILLIALVVFAVWLLVHIRPPKINAMTVVTGGVKVGKSTFSVFTVLSQLRIRRLKVRIFNFFCRLFGKKDKRKPLPVIYSNVPLKMDYIPLTEKLLRREERFIYGSVIYEQESSLIADSMDFKDKDLNEQLLLFSKLIGHETRGGCLILDTQSISDNHFNLKRCLTSDIYVHHMIKWVPFFLLCWYREERYDADNNALTVYDEDIQSSLHFTLIPKSVWKKFDCYCYSVLTDDLPVSDKITHGKKLRDLKARHIVSFRKFKNGGTADVKNVNGRK